MMPHDEPLPHPQDLHNSTAVGRGPIVAAIKVLARPRRCQAKGGSGRGGPEGLRFQVRTTATFETNALLRKLAAQLRHDGGR